MATKEQMESKKPDVDSGAIIYSNFDHEYDEEVRKDLDESDSIVFQHAAWNFCGYVWKADGKYHNEVWVYGSPVECFTADNLEDVINYANIKYGGNNYGKIKRINKFNSGSTTY